MAAAGRQPRGNRLPEVISEYKSTFTVTWPFAKPLKLPRLLSSEEACFFGVPAHTKALTCEKRQGADDEGQNPRKLCAKLAILRTEAEFVEEALKLSHPFDSSEAVTDDIKMYIFEVLTEAASGTSSFCNEKASGTSRFCNEKATSKSSFYKEEASGTSSF